MVKWSKKKQNYFNEKLIEGHCFEKLASQKICELNKVTVDHFRCNYKYDFKTSDDITYEVKHDNTSIKTGNFFIEYSSDDQPSGIMTTEAKYHILISGEKYYVIKTDDIKQLINDKKYMKSITVEYTSKTEGFIFRISTIEKYSVCLT